MGGIYAIWRQTSNKYAVAGSLVSIRAKDNGRRDRRISIPVKLVTLERRSKITLDSRGAPTQGATRTAFQCFISGDRYAPWTPSIDIQASFFDHRHRSSIAAGRLWTGAGLRTDKRAMFSSISPDCDVAPCPIPSIQAIVRGKD